MLRQTQLCKEQTLATLLEYRRQLLNDLYQLEIYLCNKLYSLLQTGIDDEHRIHLDTIYAPEYPYIISEEVAFAAFNALNVTQDQVLDACNNALLQMRSRNSSTLLKYREFQDMEVLKAAYDATFVAEEFLQKPVIAMNKYKAPKKTSISN